MNFQIFAKLVSSRCNLHCTYCYYHNKASLIDSPVSSMMNEGLMARYIRQHLHLHPGPEVRFSWHGGEPTLAGLSAFRRIVELQKKHAPPGKIAVNGIQTNGTLIDEAWADFFAEHAFGVGLSLDGRSDLHDLYRKKKDGAGSFAETMRGYQYLRRNDIPVDILCVVSADNVMYPLQVYSFFKDIGVRHLSFLPLVELLATTPQPITSDRTVPSEAFGAFLCIIFDLWIHRDIGTIKIQIFEEALRTAFGQEHSLCLFRPTCGDIPVLEQNGDVFACDHFVAPARRLGNIGQTSLGKILAGEALAAFGAAKRRTLPVHCHTCPVLPMCNGECPKNRFLDLPNDPQKGNYLCAGYRLFFTHCQPFVQAVAEQWQRQSNLSG